MGEPALEELKNFIAEKIKSLRRELSLYESMLALLEESSSKRSKKPIERGRGEVIDIMAGEKSIGLLVRDQEVLDVKLFFDASVAELNIDLLERKIETLNSQAKIYVEKSPNGTVKGITVKNAGTGVIAEGVIEIIKEHLIEEFRRRRSAPRSSL